MIAETLVDGRVGVDRASGACKHGPGAQVGRAQPERLLDEPQVMVRADQMAGSMIVSKILVTHTFKPTKARVQPMRRRENRIVQQCHGQHGVLNCYDEDNVENSRLRRRVANLVRHD